MNINLIIILMYILFKRLCISRTILKWSNETMAKSSYSVLRARYYLEIIKLAC